ncbi:carbohydrate ABC transporter substrate-binding protein [Paenibacillus sp. IB182496]|uniref:Carbohydrate ABC transporter substrate-binding protein n=1 Tax=Paenibacillus sabuli TaxID=2772509 RepID=A0A927GPY0_9BACL|nr:ABC transporter substrate-binding protein [Paenibacillus sabuli]MBD2843944.1 carbohydrate ABC transporter substrate-binding protein [Paenibacillus sabuli]
MNQNKFKRVWPIAMLVPVLALGACSDGNGGANSGTASSGGGGRAEGGTWTGTITMYAQAYTPNAKNISGIQAEQKMLATLAEAYEAEHPGIDIQFVDEEFKDYTQTVRVKAAAGEMFDVFWGQWADLNGTLPKGIAVDLTPYLNAPNPYLPDQDKWVDAMNETVVNETVAPGGEHYNINGDYVATAFFYNKDLFEQAGIEELPTTWNELLALAAQLQEAGIVPMSQAPDYGWFQRHFLSDFYAEEYDTIAGFDEAPGVSSKDEAVAIHKGILSTGDERLMAWWPIFKTFTDTWKPDYLTADVAVVTETARNDFLAGKTAIFYDGSWVPNLARDAQIQFELGSFNFPILEPSVTPLTNGLDVSGAVGGPNAAFQFAVATKEANKTMKEPGKLEAVIDWLHFIGTPGHVEQVVNENGTFVPTWPGTSPNAEMKELAEQSTQALRVVSIGNSSANLLKDIQRTFGLYLSGNIGLEEATESVQKALDAAQNEYKTKNDIDFSAY